MADDPRRKKQDARRLSRQHLGTGPSKKKKEK